MTAAKTKRGRGRPPIYPWEDWFSRRRFVVTRGKDFTCRSDTMIQYIRNMAGPRFFAMSIALLPAEDGSRITVYVLGHKQRSKVNGYGPRPNPSGSTSFAGGHNGR